MTSRWHKALAALLALCMTAGIAGCSGGESSETDTTDTAQTAQTGETSETESEEVKVGYIFHGDAKTDGVSGEMNAQRILAGTHSSVETMYIDNVSITDFEKAVQTLANAGCSYIVSESPVYKNVLSSTAGKYMNINFIAYGTNVRSANIAAYTEEIFQGAYVAGMVAAYNSESEKIGVVADTDLLYPIPVINAAALGMQLVYSDAEVVAAFATADDEIETAVNALKNDGCDVIICYTESRRAAQLCEEKGIKFIDSVDHGSDYSDYGNMLMYFGCGRSSYYLSQYKKMTMDTWEGDTFTGTMANGTVTVSDALPAAKDGTQDIIGALVPKVTGGLAYIFNGELKDINGSVKYLKGDYMSAAEIYNMDWYVYGVRLLGNYRQPVTDLTENSFEIQYD